MSLPETLRAVCVRVALDFGGRTAEAFARVPPCEARGPAKCPPKETGSAVAVVCVKASVVHNI